MKKIIITGAAGYIGSQLSEYFLKKNYIILGIDNFYSGNKKAIKHLKQYPNFEFLKYDLQNEKIIKIIKKRYDIFIHLAAQTSVDISINNFNETYDLNINTLSNSLLLSDILNCKLFIFTSSAAVYGDIKKFPISESESLVPKSSYGISKKINEEQIRLFSKKTKTKFVILRLFNIYGVISKYVKNFGVISIWINAILNKKKLYVHDYGNCVRDFVYITDLIQIIDKISLKKPKEKIKIFNLGSSKKTKISEILNLILKYFKSNKIILKKKKIIKRKLTKEQIFASYSNNIKLKNYIKHEFMSLKDGLNKNIKFILKNNIV